MDNLSDFIAGVVDGQQRERVEEVFAWIKEQFPELEAEIKWNQPMLTDHGTFIIGFSLAKKHLAVSPEGVTVKHLANDIAEAGYQFTKEIIRIPWNKPVNYELLDKMIAFNILDKANCNSFFRK
ncbi:hypothetical protein SAMN04488134_102304 [Amphibacillus marinus]|uniref:YdhG-like domain-containing protein n=1 Tax=Amphibacillus marinus TaxID=872970 RepID=A0A1H8KIL0_9BACI|nr:iron chaperone [Amphibacillus marinus]SEN92810.1 hypothetical protein SAMN04488134_102304 [Amphibacillus marinus]